MENYKNKIIKIIYDYYEKRNSVGVSLFLRNFLILNEEILELNTFRNQKIQVLKEIIKSQNNFLIKIIKEPLNDHKMVLWIYF